MSALFPHYKKKNSGRKWGFHSSPAWTRWWKFSCWQRDVQKTKWGVCCWGKRCSESVHCCFVCFFFLSSFVHIWWCYARLLACSSALCVLSKVSRKLLLMSVFLPNPASHGFGFNMFEEILNAYIVVCLKLSSEAPKIGKNMIFLHIFLKPLLKLQASTLFQSWSLDFRNTTSVEAES